MLGGWTLRLALIRVDTSRLVVRTKPAHGHALLRDHLN